MNQVAETPVPVVLKSSAPGYDMLDIQRLDVQTPDFELGWQQRYYVGDCHARLHQAVDVVDVTRDGKASLPAHGTHLLGQDLDQRVAGNLRLGKHRSVGIRVNQATSHRR